ncbi:Tfp pilus assembly protein FimT [Bradyrhizobium japonicum]|uniref:hypothetical protein n=1 Tax=Bradyrhizobium japonicum TaxID=375 RepID=UPI0022265844|nr:hypothetical protein [Bradyrhizobium japonicum]MCW2225690.1 Tfp pilus assembly protein FimT [Bradyrhizobium japonicum]MCW2340902.1 Tfp pilus assembly protein FimT [Bradyrhizobium japonicum]
MGADFLEKAAPQFEKCWDKGRLDLVAEDLFTRLPTTKSRAFEATLLGAAPVKKGEKITIDRVGNGLLVSRGHTELALSEDPPSAVVEAIEVNCGVAQGIVDEVHEMAGVVEISVCIARPQ